MTQTAAMWSVLHYLPRCIVAAGLLLIFEAVVRLMRFPISYEAMLSQLNSAIVLLILLKTPAWFVLNYLHALLLCYITVNVWTSPPVLESLDNQLLACDLAFYLVPRFSFIWWCVMLVVTYQELCPTERIFSIWLSQQFLEYLHSLQPEHSPDFVLPDHLFRADDTEYLDRNSHSIVGARMIQVKAVVETDSPTNEIFPTPFLSEDISPSYNCHTCGQRGHVSRTCKNTPLPEEEQERLRKRHMNKKKKANRKRKREGPRFNSSMPE